MPPTRLKGNKLTLTIGDISVDLEATTAELDNEEASGDTTTFADAKAGGSRQFFLSVTSTQSTSVDSFWRYVWANTGETADFVLRPHGNEVPTADEPHFTGQLTIGPKPKLGGAAGTAAHTFDTRMDVDGEPALITAPVAP